MREATSRLEALRRGLTYYFTGQACREGHRSERMSCTGGCVECNRLRIFLPPDADPEIREYYDKVHTPKLRKSYAMRLERVLPYLGDRQKSIAQSLLSTFYEKVSLSEKQWSLVHDLHRAGRERRKSHPGYISLERFKEDLRSRRVWSYSHSTGDKCSSGHDLMHEVFTGRVSCPTCDWEKSVESARQSRRNRRARKMNSVGRNTAADVKRILMRQKHKCVYCKTNLKAGYHVDHIIPLSKGGSNGPKNLQCLCAFCNLSKGAKMPEEFARSIGMLL